jgi:hypothetical protein
VKYQRIRGTQRINFILSSYNLPPYVRKVGYTAFYDASGSDHRGAFIKLSNNIIGNKIELQRPKKQNIGSKSKKNNIYEYKQEDHREFTKERIYKSINRIYATALLQNYDEQYVTRKLNEIDRKVTKIILRAESNKGSIQYKNEWSIGLHQQSLLCRYWSTIERGMKNG